jgi:hypothetical protein
MTTLLEKVNNLSTKYNRSNELAPIKMGNNDKKKFQDQIINRLKGTVDSLK